MLKITSKRYQVKLKENIREDDKLLIVVKLSKLKAFNILFASCDGIYLNFSLGDSGYNEDNIDEIEIFLKTYVK